MKSHTCVPLCWHLYGKNLKKTICSLQEIVDMNIAWDFVKEMKNNPEIDEIIWTQYNQNVNVHDEILHLIKKDGGWLRNDIIDWNKNKI